MTTARALVSALVLALLAQLSPLAAQGFGIPGMGGDHARASAFHRVDGDVVQLVISIEIDDGWHLYHDELGEIDGNEPIGKPTRVTPSGDGVTWGGVQFPEPLTLDQPGLDSWIWGHEHQIVLYAQGELAAGASLGELSVKLDGLTCEDYGTCVPYAESITSGGAGPDSLFEAFPSSFGGDPSGGLDELVARGTVEGPGLASARTEAEWDAVSFPEFSPQRTDGGGEGEGGTSRGFFAWLALAFVAGMILNVMPCVLPVISIKVLSFVQQAGEDRKRIFALGVAFAAGIVTVFLVLATLAAGIGLSWGEQFQSAGFLIAMIGVVFAFGLSMFGVFELGVPAGVGGLAAGPAREGLVDALFKGMLATVLATPCSGPFLGSTLTWTLSQPTLVIFAIFLSLGLGMALPYVVLTANPALLKIVPRPGPWMDTFKQSMGFVLMATVIYLMVSLRQDLLLFTVMFLLFVGLGCWWYGRFAGYDKSKGKRYAHLVMALALVAGGGRLAFVEIQGLFSAEGHGWVDFDPDAFAAHLADGDNVLVDFTADWCPNCKYNEKVVYDHEEVVSAMQGKGVVRMKADITHDDARTAMIERFMEKLGARAIPFLAIFPGDTTDAPHVRYDIVTRGDVLEIVASLPGG
jgi:thiol:disulfide interchange protein DsbD